ncbi:hypothetical protein BDY19DRAFT_660273 [Irpex rosettiformis]|uniref:Uncharacterized protein n=1 Tax=Irpex rosettiformis TaxID=378272 RepID=A0ACB8TN77_9APHY|nr:hypothetical protein BDY19DRAFT_660273 [Irpex rosettiformis]
MVDSEDSCRLLSKGDLLIFPGGLDQNQYIRVGLRTLTSRHSLIENPANSQCFLSWWSAKHCQRMKTNGPLAACSICQYRVPSSSWFTAEGLSSLLTSSDSFVRYRWPRHTLDLHYPSSPLLLILQIRAMFGTTISSLERSFECSQAEQTGRLTNSDDVLHLLPILPPGMFSSHVPEGPTQSGFPTSRSETSMRVKHLAWARALSRSTSATGMDSGPALGTVSGLGHESRIRGPRPLSRTPSRSGSIRQSQSLSVLVQPIVRGQPEKSRSEDVEESPKFKLRRARVREMERLQELEDERDADKQGSLDALQGLLTSQPFSDVAASFEDLDGLGHVWEKCSIRRAMKEQWNQRALDMSSCLSSEGQLNILDGRNYRSVHALFADLNAQSEGRLSHSIPLPCSKGDIYASASMPLISRCQPLSRTSAGNTGKPRPSALSREHTLSETSSQRITASHLSSHCRSWTSPGTSTVSGSVDQKSVDTTRHSTGRTMFLQYSSISSRFGTASRQGPFPLSRYGEGSGHGLTKGSGKKTQTLPRMTRTLSSASSDSYGHDAAQDTTLLAHVQRLAHVEALREVDSDAEAEAPLMVRPRSSGDSSSSSSFGLKPLRAKRATVRPKVGLDRRHRIGEATSIAREEGDIDMKELERVMQKDDPTLLWADGPYTGEGAALSLPPPPMPEAHSATWCGARASHILGSTISRASGRGKHSTRRRPLPFVNAMETYLADPNSGSLAPLAQALND